MFFLLSNIFLLLIIVFLLIILSWVWPPNSPWAPWWRTNKKTAHAICKLANINSKDIMYDLGCGDGTAIITAAKDFGAKAVGIEIDFTRYCIAKMRVVFSGLSKKIALKRGNFFGENFKDATIVNVYLVPKTLNKLVPKLKKECKKGTRVISYRYEMPLTLKKYDKENELRLYVV